jgi:hypothetical protein
MDRLKGGGGGSYSHLPKNLRKEINGRKRKMTERKRQNKMKKRGIEKGNHCQQTSYKVKLNGFKLLARCKKTDFPNH